MNQLAFIDKKKYSSLKEEICDWDIETFKSLVSLSVSPEKKKIIVNPEVIFPRQESVIAIHWHPENVPFHLCRERIDTMFPNKQSELIIPTQHNELLTFGEFSGTEVDCYAQDFNLKIQLLLHFEKSKTEEATMLKAILDHTFKYRSSQLFNFIDIVTNVNKSGLFKEAIDDTGAGSETVSFVQIYMKKLKTLIELHYQTVPPVSIKNKLVRNYFHQLSYFFELKTINRAQIFLNAVKKVMKKDFRLDYFYEIQNIIEEVRSVGGGIIVPHPEQFWPVLLADYDVDGYEVWNPQSLEFTNFLINVVKKKNEHLKKRNRPLLITMGDDCHLGDKLTPDVYKSESKKIREVGYQDAWDDYAVKKNLILAGFEKEKIMEEYKERLLG